MYNKRHFILPHLHGTTGQPYILRPILIVKFIDLCLLALLILIYNFILLFLVFYPTTEQQELRYWKGKLNSLINKLFLSKLLQWHCVHCIDNYPEAAISKISPSLSALKNVTTESMHSSCLIEQTYILWSTMVASAVIPVIF